MDTARKMRLMRLFEQKGAEYVGRWDELKYLISPFVAQNAKEQAFFYSIFEEFQALCEADAQRWNETLPIPEAEPEPTVVRTYRWPILGTLGILGLSLVFLLMIKPPKPEPIEARIAVPQLKIYEGDSIQIDNRTPLGDIDSTQFRWELFDVATGELEYSLTDFHFRWRAKGYSQAKLLTLRPPDLGNNSLYSSKRDSFRFVVHCISPPEIPKPFIRPRNGRALSQDSSYTFEVTRVIEAGIDYEWIFSGKDTLRGTSVQYAFPKGTDEGMVKLRLINRGEKVDPAGVYCTSEMLLRYPLGGNKPILTLMSYRSDVPHLSHKLSLWYWLMCLLPLLGVPWLLWVWYKNIRPTKPAEKTEEELEAAYPVHDTAPYEIPFPTPEQKIVVPAAFYRIADVMRRREVGIRTEFDSHRSVQATIDAGGYPTFQTRAMTRPAEYVMLVQRHDEAHQQDRLLARLATFLVGQDAPVKLYFHNGDFDYIWSQRDPEGIPLGQLYRRYPDHRLIILGNAHGLVNPYATRQPELIRRKLDQLLSWSRRMIISTEPAVDWSWQEALLHQHFLLYPATTDAILQGLELLDRTVEYTPGSFVFHQIEHQKRFPEASARYQTWDTVEALRAYCMQDPELFRWLCGISVSAVPDWSLTVAIGTALGIEVTHDRLLALSRIPWLANNAPNNSLRLALLQELSDTDTQLARQAITTELASIEDQVRGSFAQTEWTTNLATQQFAQDPNNPTYKQQIKELNAMGLLSLEQIEELDFVVREQADATSLGPSASLSLDDWLHAEEPIKWAIKPLFYAIFALLIGTAGIVFGLEYNKEEHTGAAQNLFQITVNQDDEALAYLNQAIALSSQRDSVESLTAWQAMDDSLVKAIDLLSQAIKLRAPEAYPLADSNWVNMLYNHRAKGLNYFLLDSLSVLSSFERAYRFDDTLSSLVPPGNTYPYLAVQHLQGLYSWYMGKETDQLSVISPVTDPTAQNASNTSQILLPSVINNSELVEFLNTMKDPALVRTSYLKASQNIGGGGAILYEQGRWVVQKGAERDPIIYLSYEGAGAYLRWLETKSPESAYQLPSEKEWEEGLRQRLVLPPTFLLSNAEKSYENILSQSPTIFFDSLRRVMPVNLQTLLEAVSGARTYLHAKLLDAVSQEPLTDVRVYTQNESENLLSPDEAGVIFYDYGYEPEQDGLHQQFLQVAGEGYPAKGYPFTLFANELSQEVILIEPETGSEQGPNDVSPDSEPTQVVGQGLPAGLSKSEVCGSVRGRNTLAEFYREVPANAQITDIQAYGGLYVDGFTIYYTKNNRQTSESVQIGSKGGSAYPRFDVRPGLSIVGLNVRCGDALDAVQFVFSDGSTTPSYGGMGGSPHEIRLSEGAKMRGFFGKQDGYLLDLGMLFKAPATKSKQPPSSRPAWANQYSLRMYCQGSPVEIADEVSEIASHMEAQNYAYNAKPFTDVSGIYHRVMDSLSRRCPNHSYPSPELYRDTRSIGRWYEELGAFVHITDPLNQDDLIKPGVVMFYGRSGTDPSALNREELFQYSGINHIGIVVKVETDKSGRVINYWLFHGIRPGKPAGITKYHQREFSGKSTFPAYGNGNAPWIGVAPLITDYIR